MERKYEILKDDTVRIGSKNNGVDLYRIRALKDFGDVKEGDFGGYIEKEDNLSHCGNCWIYEYATVYGNAVVCDDAQIHNDATVAGRARVCEKAWVTDDAYVYGDACVKGTAIVKGRARVFDDAVIDGDTTIGGDAKIIHGSVLIDESLHKGTVKNNVVTYDTNPLERHYIIAGLLLGGIIGCILAIIM